MMAASSKFAFKIAAKPLQVETWLLLTAYRNLSSSYPTASSPTPYGVRFSHNTCVSDDSQTDDRQTTHRTTARVTNQRVNDFTTECVRGSDVVFALDTSGSVGLQNVRLMSQFIALLIDTLNVDSPSKDISGDPDPSLSRVGMLTYADSASVQFDLNTFHRRAAILQAINVRYRGGTTNAADALRYIGLQLL